MLNLHCTILQAEELLDVFFVASTSLRPKLSLNNKSKRVWHLRLSRNDPSDKTRPIDADRVDGVKLAVIFKNRANEAVNVNLEVKPDTLKDHVAGNPRMKWVPRDVVLGVSVWDCTVENQTLLVASLV